MQKHLSKRAPTGMSSGEETKELYDLFYWERLASFRMTINILRSKHRPRRGMEDRKTVMEPI